MEIHKPREKEKGIGERGNNKLQECEEYFMKLLEERKEKGRGRADTEKKKKASSTKTKEKTLPLLWKAVIIYS
jgi:hypothetical protein